MEIILKYLKYDTIKMYRIFLRKMICSEINVQVLKESELLRIFYLIINNFNLQVKFLKKLEIDKLTQIFYYAN